MQEETNLVYWLPFMQGNKQASRFPPNGLLVIIPSGGHESLVSATWDQT